MGAVGGLQYTGKGWCHCLAVCRWQGGQQLRLAGRVGIDLTAAKAGR